MTRDPYAIPTEKILERLRFENPWWKSNTIDPGVSRMKRRLYFNLFFPSIKYRYYRIEKSRLFQKR